MCAMVPKYDMIDLVDLSKARSGVATGVLQTIKAIRDGTTQYVPVILPTRYGKSDYCRVTAYLAQRLGLVYTTIILNPVRVLRDQIVDDDKVQEARIRYKISGNLMCHTWDSPQYTTDGTGRLRLSIAPNDECITSMTTQAALRYKGDILEWLDHIRYVTNQTVLLIVDEVQFFSVANVWGSFVKDWVNHGGVVVLATATPERHDGYEIPGIPCHRDPVEFYEMKQYSRLDENHVRVNVYNVQTEILRIDMDFITTHGVYVSFGEAWAQDIICKCQRLPFDVDIPNDKTGEMEKLSEWGESQARSYLGTIVRNKKVIREGVKIAVHTARHLRQIHPDVSIIAFCGNDQSTDEDDNAHARLIKRYFAKESASLDVLIVTSTIDSDEKSSDLLRKFCRGRGDVLVCKNMAGAGLDAPRAKVILDLSSVRTPGSFIQRLMRGATPYGTQKVFYYISPDDILSRALFRRFVEDEGGSYEGRGIRELLDSYVIESPVEPKGEKKGIWIDDVKRSDFEDSQRLRDKAEMLRYVEWLEGKLPTIGLGATKNEVARLANDIGVDAIERAMERDGWQSAYDEQQLDDIREDCNLLAVGITNLIAGYKTDRNSDEWERTIRSVWNSAKLAAGWPIELRKLPPSKVNDRRYLMDLKEALQNLRTQTVRSNARQ